MCVRTSFAIQNLAACCLYSFKSLMASAHTPLRALDFSPLELFIP